MTTTTRHNGTKGDMTHEEARAARRAHVESYVAELPSAEEMAKPVVSLVYHLHDISEVVNDAAVLADNAGPETTALVRLLEDLGAIVEAVVSSCIADSAAGPRAGADVRRALERIVQLDDLRLQHYADRAWHLGTTVGK